MNEEGIGDLRGLGRTRQLTEDEFPTSVGGNVAHAEVSMTAEGAGRESARLRHVRTPVGVGVGADMTCEDFASTSMPMADGTWLTRYNCTQGEGLLFPRMRNRNDDCVLRWRGLSSGTRHTSVLPKDSPSHLFGRPAQ